MSLGGDVQAGTKAEPDKTGQEETPAASAQTKPATEETEPAAAHAEQEDVGTVKDSRQLANYLLLLDYLPNTIRNESKHAEALRMVNDLLTDKNFTDEIPRKNCLGIRKLLVLNNAPLLPYLDESAKALRGVRLFPFTYPDSVLEDISGNTLRLRVRDGKANIIQRVAWNKLRADEGEDHIVVTIINTPQLSKLSEEFREYLYARALFLGVDSELLLNRFDRASGLPKEKIEELGKLTGFFRQTLFDEEDEDDD